MRNKGGGTLGVSTVLKIGGSVLTKKDQVREIDQENMETALNVLEKNHKNLVLIHGAGSYGHPLAQKYSLKEGSRKGIYEIHKTVKELNQEIIERLEKRGVPSYPIHPSSCSYRNQKTEIMAKQIEMVRSEGFLPVLHGDAIVTKEKGFTVFSGDKIITELAEKLEPENVGMCTGEQGVLDSNEEVMDLIESIDQFQQKEISFADVSGGMKNKVEELLDLKEGGRIFGLEQLEGFLNQEEVGTLVKSSKF